MKALQAATSSSPMPLLVAENDTMAILVYSSSVKFVTNHALLGVELGYFQQGQDSVLPFKP